MAKQNKKIPQGETSSITTNGFNKGMIKDMSESFMPEGTWYHARNLVNNSNQGDLGVVGNEPSNLSCVTLAYTIVGAIPIVEDYWAIFSTNDAISEVGLFIEKSCEYYIISRDSSWNFRRSNLIIGEAKANFDCSYQLYWADGVNPDRTLNIGDVRLGNYPDVLNNIPWPGVPYICQDTIPGPCENCIPNTPLTLDVEKTRIASLMKIPCVTIQKGYSGGQLPNGSYYATIAYSVNQQRVTDYFNPSQIQPIFSHENVQGSLDINFSNLDTDNFNEFQLVVVSTINQQTVARIIGYYNTQTNSVSLDVINPELETVPIQYIPLRSPAYEKSEAIYAVNNYLIRTSPTGRLDFNYQPLANQIQTNWVLVEYPADYYEKGGNENGYMRDEQYCFWIRWVYNTGERSSSYHIPGRSAFTWEQATHGIASPDNIEYQQDNNFTPKTWEVVNTAYATTPVSQLPIYNAPLIPGLVIAKGKMGYWESTETYPADKPDIWNSSSYSWTGTADPQYDLCGLPIRHHKMPGDFLYSNGSTTVNPIPTANYSHVRVNNLIGDGITQAIAIRVLGVEFENIKAPVDNNGNIIPGIVGYEILRSNRQGNRSIIAKGIINNMRSYYENTGGDYPSESAKEILYPNYVGNYLGSDFTISRYGGDRRDPKEFAINFLSNYKSDFFTFHSPDTNFQRPFLSATELKLYGELGHAFNMRGQFEPVPGHPKEKLVTNLSLILTTVLAIGYAAKAVRGDQSRTLRSGGTFNAGIPVLATVGNPIGVIANVAGSAAYHNPLSPVGFSSIANLLSNIVGQDAAIGTLAGVRATFDASATVGLGTIGTSEDIEIKQTDFNNLPGAIQVIAGVPIFAYYWTTGIDALMDLVRAVIPYRDYALRSYSHLNLSFMHPGNATLNNTRRWIKDSTYLENQFTVLGNLEVNNLFRPQAVALQIGNTGFNNPSIVDRSVQTVGSVLGDDDSIGPSGAVNYGITWKKPSDGFFRTTTSCYYAGLKVRYRNQYGQIDSPKQITTGCVFNVLPDGSQITNAFIDRTSGESLVVIPRTPVILGGDVYIGRYTEKNTFFYFYDWLYNVVDGTELDYTLKYMINFPRFYADFTKYDVSEIFQGFGDITESLFDGESGIATLQNALPSGRYNLDTNEDIFGSNFPSFTLNLRLGAKNAYMYLFQSGIRDFFVESEYNVDHRDYGDLKQERIYDPYGYANLKEIFDTDIIKFGNYYKYDISLGVSKVYNSYISWGNMQDRSYNPEVSENCYTYFPNRVIYSLPANEEDKKDYWRVYLVNNYNDFTDKVVAFKSINKNGAIILFANSTPLLFNAVDQLQTVAGTKITIGDGGLFSQPLQTLNNADPEFQHGASQDRLSIINTPAGIYWMSASQGKVFTVADGMMAISDMGMKWWFSKYLKFFILDQFPDFDLLNNPVFGVGCQSIYDNDNGVLYFSKRDYRLRPEYLANSQYVGNAEFLIFNGLANTRVLFGNPLYFEDLSWTISFDTKLKAWLSFHDWHPEYAMSAVRGFNTTNTVDRSSTIWKHGNFTNSFCSFYGVKYPWEIDYVASTGQAVNTTRSIEYLLESYVYDADGIDRFQILDYNFDQAVVYNLEQVSGTLKLNLTPKNNAPLILTYPKINFNSIDVLYSKEEQKIRFNQFWDVTKDRGEFFNGVLVQQTIWNTELNGYIRTLNPSNLNYSKSPFERKKFRHYLNHVVLRRTVSDNVKMLLKIINNKLLNSPR